MYLQPSQRFHFEGFKDMSPGSGKAKVAPAIFGCVSLYPYIYISISISMYLQPSQRFHFEGFKDMSPGSGKAKVAPAIFGWVALYVYIHTDIYVFSTLTEVPL